MNHPLYWVLGIVTALRCAELVHAARNTRRLKAEGAIEIAPEQYPFFIALHAGWIVWMAVAISPDVQPLWWLLGLFGLLQIGRVWAIASLGKFWTTRIITLPGAPLVRRGPYAFMPHPNYAIVAGELAVLPLAFGNWTIAIIASVLNAALLGWRISVENRALAKRAPSNVRDGAGASK